jgi:hypothetical protein
LVGKRDTREVGVHLSYALEFGASWKTHKQQWSPRHKVFQYL